MALWKALLRGGYPQLLAERRRDATLWHASYIATYLERDVRSLRQVGDLALFQGFLRMLAARSGQLLNLTDVSRALGVAVNTVSVGLYAYKGLWLTLLLYTVFIGLSFAGWRAWQRRL